MPNRYKVTNPTSGTVELKGYRIVLSPQCWDIILGEPSEDLLWLKGRRKVSIERVVEVDQELVPDRPAGRPRLRKSTEAGGN